MLKVNLTAYPVGGEEVLFTAQRTADEIADNPIVPGGTITEAGVDYTIEVVGMTGGNQVGDDWIAEVRIEVTLA